MIKSPFTNKRMLVAEGLHLPVSRHFYYSYFGVRGRYDTVNKTGIYINGDTPGTGFFARETDSHSYRRFIAAVRKGQKQNFWTLLLRKEFDFEREIEKLGKLIEDGKDTNRRTILDQYLNALLLAKEENLLQRVVRAVKDKMGHRPNKTLTSILSHYKSRIATLQHEVKSAQININEFMSGEALAEWGHVVEEFGKLVDSRRLWHVEYDGSRCYYHQVFFDMGIFDFVQSPFDTPVMRDSSGTHYYLYPMGLIKAQSSVDFEMIPIEDLNLEYGVVDLNTLENRPDFYGARKKGKKKGSHRRQAADPLSTLYGTSRSMVVGQLTISNLNLTFYCNHTGPVQDFVKAFNDFKHKGWDVTIRR